MPPQTMFIGNHILRFPELPSTNNYAAELIKNNKPAEGTVVVTEHQTSGKGQRGKTWLSSKNANLTCSVILYPTFLQAAEQFYLNMAMALAMKNAVSSLIDIPLMLKWPNDLFVNNKKTGGMLIESSISGKYTQHNIIGFGINLNQTEFDGVPHATSLKMLTGKEFSAEQLLHDLLRQVEWNYLLLKQRKFEEIRSDFNAVLYKKGMNATFSMSDNQTLEAQIVGVDTEGNIMLNTQDGTIMRFQHHQIRMIL